MDANRGAVAFRAGDGELELARQMRELRVQRRPLAQNFRERTRVDLLVGRDAGEMVGGDGAHATAGSLNRVQPHLGQFGEHVGDVGDFQPVQLDVLPRRKMSPTLVVDPRHMGDGAQLRAGEHAVRDADAQQRRMALDVDAVLQPQGAKLVLRQLAGEIAARLVAELRHAGVDESLVVIVVPIHEKRIPESVRVVRPGVRGAS